MTPALYASYANRLFSYRWLFVAAFIAGIAIVLAFAIIASKPLVVLAGVVIGPAVILPWGLFCMCVWFHPQRGNLQLSGKFSNGFPHWLKVGIRWYYAFLLNAFFAVGAFVWPILAFRWLSNS